jgi:hypothetical protein
LLFCIKKLKKTHSEAIAEENDQKIAKNTKKRPKNKNVRCVFLFYLFSFFKGIFYPFRGRERELTQNQDELTQNQDELTQNQDELTQNQDELTQKID